MNSGTHGLLVSIAAAAGTILVPLVVRAHGGEDHDKKPAAAPVAETGGRAAQAQTENFELVVKYSEKEPGKPVTLRLLLSDYATNEPVAGAEIDVELSGPAGLSAKAKPGGSPGFYEATLAFPKQGKYDLVASVSAGEVVDLIAVNGLDVGPAQPAAEAPHEHPALLWVWASAALVALALLAFGFVLWRRRKGRASSAAVALAVAVCSSTAHVRAHGGEDHGAQPRAAASTAGTGAISLPKESQFLLGVLTEVVSERELRNRIVALGQVVPRSDRHAELFPPQPGRVLPGPAGRLPFIGERVQRGQVLAVIEASLSATDIAQLGSQRIETEVRLSQAEAELKQAQRNLERVRSLQGVVAAREIQQAELALEVARGARQRALRESQLLSPARGRNLARFTIVSPLDGVIGETDLATGEQVDTTRRLFSVLDPSVLWVEAKVYEADIGRIDQNAEARISVESYPGEYFSGRLFALAPQVDPATRTATVTFEVPNPDGRLRPGMFADVQVATGQARRALAVPDAALVQLDGRQVVFIHTAPEEFVTREVALDTRDGAYWAVRGGIEDGERVVVQGVHQLRSAAVR